MLIRSEAIFSPLAPNERLSASHLAALSLEDGSVVAVFDAAANHQVPELLQADTQTASCLWQGKAKEHLGDCAPWMGVLQPDSKVLQNLFTEGPAPWNWWTFWPGILFRPRRSPEDLRRHLRRLSRVTDAQGQAYFLRFWEPQTAESLWASHAQDPSHVAWRFGEDIAAVIWPTPDGIAKVELPDPVAAGPLPERGIDAYRPLFRTARWHNFTNRVFTGLGKEGPLFDIFTQQEVQDMCNAARQAGYRREGAIWDVVRAGILLRSAGRDFSQETLAAWGDAMPPDDVSAARRLLARARLVAAE